MANQLEELLRLTEQMEQEYNAAVAQHNASLHKLQEQLEKLQEGITDGEESGRD